MRDTLATSANSSRDICSKTKLSVYWTGPTNHNFLYFQLSSRACSTDKGKKIPWSEFLSTLLVRVSSIYTVLGTTLQGKIIPLQAASLSDAPQIYTIQAPHVSQEKLSRICPDVLLYAICIDILYLHISIDTESSFFVSISREACNPGKLPRNTT